MSEMYEQYEIKHKVGDVVRWRQPDEHRLRKKNYITKKN